MTKVNRFFILLALIGLSVTMLFSSCNYNLSSEKLAEMPEGREKDSLMFLKDYGVSYGKILYAMKDTVYLLPQPDYNAKSTVVTTSNDVFKVVDRKIVTAKPGDVYKVVKGQNVVKERILQPIEKELIHIEITDENEKVSSAWLKAEDLRDNLGPAFMMKANYKKTQKTAIIIIIILGVMAVLTFIGLKIYNVVCRKRNITPIKFGSVFGAVYIGFGVLLGILTLVAMFNPEWWQQIYYNPHILGNWANLNTFERMGTVFFIGMVVFAVVMIVDVVLRTRNIWCIFTLLGQLAMGIVIPLIIMYLGVIIFIIVMTLVPIIGFLFVGIVGSKTGALQTKSTAQELEERRTLSEKRRAGIVHDQY